MKSESDLVKELQMRATENGSRLFRNNVGVGKSTTGSVIRFGLFPGSADLIGITPIIITQEMVGKTVGVFTSEECKGKKGRTRPEQLIWHEMVARLGGISAIVKTEEEYFASIRNYIEALRG